MAKKRRKKGTTKKATLGTIITLCVLGVILIVAAATNGDFAQNIQDILQNFSDNAGGYHDTSRQALELADLETNADKLIIYAVDTGNSDCILLRTPEGASMLVDAADNDDFKNISATLRALGIEKLDVAVATHPDADHIGSMDDVVENFSPDTFYMPAAEKQTATYNKMISALEAQSITPVIVGDPMEFMLGSVHAQVLNPFRDYDNVNDCSIVLLLTYGETKILLTGDAEKEALGDILSQYANEMDVDILKVGHHGSSTSTTQELLDATTPDIAFITCGADNDYGHPHRETTNLLDANNVVTLRTDTNGDIAVFSDGQQFFYETAA